MYAMGPAQYFLWQNHGGNKCFYLAWQAIHHSISLHFLKGYSWGCCISLMSAVLWREKASIYLNLFLTFSVSLLTGQRVDSEHKDASVPWSVQTVGLTYPSDSHHPAHGIEIKIIKPTFHAGKGGRLCNSRGDGFRPPFWSYIHEDIPQDTVRDSTHVFQNSLRRLSWPGSHKDLPASAFLVLELKVCASIPGFSPNDF